MQAAVTAHKDYTISRIDDRVYGLATGEAMAHLRRLEVEGRAVRDVRDGVHCFSRA